MMFQSNQHKHETGMANMRTWMQSAILLQRKHLWNLSNAKQLATGLLQNTSGPVMAQTAANLATVAHEIRSVIPPLPGTHEPLLIVWEHVLHFKRRTVRGLENHEILKHICVGCLVLDTFSNLSACDLHWVSLFRPAWAGFQQHAWCDKSLLWPWQCLKAMEDQAYLWPVWRGWVYLKSYQLK